VTRNRGCSGRLGQGSRGKKGSEKRSRKKSPRSNAVYQQEKKRDPGTGESKTRAGPGGGRGVKDFELQPPSTDREPSGAWAGEFKKKGEPLLPKEEESRKLRGGVKKRGLRVFD